MSYSPFTTVSEDLDNVSVIKQTQDIRFKAINKILEGTEGLPEDPKERDYLSKLLDSADRAAINLRRIDSGEQQGDKDRAAALLTTQMLSNIAKNPFLKEKGAQASPTNFADLDDPAMDGHEPVEGEMEIGVQDISYEAVMNPSHDE